MFERIKFELNLPSNARKYLEDYNDTFPQQSLPGYPVVSKVNDKSSQSLVMPRMVYDMWPYFVPFYPIYSKLLYPARNALPEFKNGIKANSLEFSLPSTTATPSYFRQIRTNRPIVNADCVNQLVIGSNLTPNELDAKIRQQIQKHEHLLKASKKNRNPSPKETCAACNCSACLPKQLPPPKPTHNPHDFHNHHHHNHHAVPDPENPINSQISQKSHSDHQDNKHYEFYRRMVQDLYDTCREEHFNSRSTEKKNDTRRSKSVTFCHSQSDDHCHCESDSDHEVLIYDKEFRKSTSTNTDVSFAKSERKKPRDQINNSKLPFHRHWKCFE